MAAVFIVSIPSQPVSHNVLVRSSLHSSGKPLHSFIHLFIILFIALNYVAHIFFHHKCNEVNLTPGGSGLEWTFRLGCISSGWYFDSQFGVHTPELTMQGMLQHALQHGKWASCNIHFNKWNESGQRIMVDMTLAFNNGYNGSCRNSVSDVGPRLKFSQESSKYYESRSCG